MLGFQKPSSPVRHSVLHLPHAHLFNDSLGRDGMGWSLAELLNLMTFAIYNCYVTTVVCSGSAGSITVISLYGCKLLRCVWLEL